jgi:TPR repeat protein
MPGPLRRLKNLVYETYLAAGGPRLDELAHLIEADDDLAACPSRDTIARLIGSPEPPARQADLVALVKVLASLAGEDVSAMEQRAAQLWVDVQLTDRLGLPISELDPFALEVHHAVAVEGHTGLTQYIEREHDMRVREVVADAVAGHSRLMVLVGASSTGKTRACWEALALLPPGWRLWRPIDPDRPQAALADLDRVAPQTVVWLNESHHYLLSHQHGEAIAARLRTLLADSARAPVLVLGTIWSGPEYFERLTRVPPLNQHDPHNQARRLVAGHHLHVPMSFEPAAVETLRSSPDPRIAAAAQFSPDGMITQYIAGGPELLRIYRTAVPGIRALLQAAMDARRLGHPPGLPLPFLAAAAEAYLTDTEWDLEDENWLEQALVVLTTPVLGARAPLHPVKRPRGSHADAPRSVSKTYRLADYLDQHGRTERLLLAVPDLFWLAARRHAGEEACAQLALQAESRGILKHACALWIRAGRYDRAAELLADAGRLTQALPWFAAAFSAGHTDSLLSAADRLVEAGRPEEALRYYRRLTDTQDTGLLTHMADRLLTCGLVREALIRYERALEADPGDAVPRIAQKLVSQGLLADAAPPWRLSDGIASELDGWATRSTEWCTRAVLAGSTATLRLMTTALVKAGRSAEAVRWCELAAGAGHTEALLLAAETLADEDRLDAALDRCVRAGADGLTEALHRIADRIAAPDRVLEWYRLAAALGDPQVLRSAADHLAGLGRLDEALEWYQRAADAGDAPSLLEAAERLADEGSTAQALDWYDRATARGSIEALQLKADCLASTGDLDEALGWYELAWAAGHPDAAEAAASELFMADRQDESLRWYERAADSGNTDSCVNAAVELVLAQRHDDAVDWCGGVVEKGLWHADATDLHVRISQQLVHLGYLDDALAWYDRAVEGGRTTVLAEAAGHLAEAGRLDEALDWYRRAAAAGHTNALTEAATQLAHHARLDDALHWYQRAVEGGRTTVLAEAAGHLAEAGRLDEALDWYQRAAAAGHTNALTDAATQLAQHGRLDDALHWYRRAATAGIDVHGRTLRTLERSGDSQSAARLRAFGRTAEGDVSAEWTTDDCE